MSTVFSFQRMLHNVLSSVSLLTTLSLDVCYIRRRSATQRVKWHLLPLCVDGRLTDVTHTVGTSDCSKHHQQS